MPSGASIYGFSPPVSPGAPGAPTGGVAAPGGAGAAITPLTQMSTSPKGWHQDPVLILVVLIGAAFLLARGAEHGLSFGFSTKVRAK